MTAARKSESHYPGASDIKRMVAAARSAGLDIGSLELSPTGVIKIIDKAAMPQTVEDEFDQWEKAGKL